MHRADLININRICREIARRKVEAAYQELRKRDEPRPDQIRVFRDGKVTWEDQPKAVRYEDLTEGQSRDVLRSPSGKYWIVFDEPTPSLPWWRRLLGWLKRRLS